MVLMDMVDCVRGFGEIALAFGKRVLANVIDNSFFSTEEDSKLTKFYHGFVLR